MTKNTWYLKALAMVMALFLLPLAALALEAGTAAAPLYLNAGEARNIHGAALEGADVLRVLKPNEAFEMVSNQAGWASIRVFTESGEMLAGWAMSQGLRQKTAEDGHSTAVIAPQNPDDRPALKASRTSYLPATGSFGVKVMVFSPFPK